MIALGWIVFVFGIAAFIIGGFASFVARVTDEEYDQTERFLGIDVFRHKKSLLLVICGVIAFLVGRSILMTEGIIVFEF